MIVNHKNGRLLCSGSSHVLGPQKIFKTVLFAPASKLFALIQINTCALRPLEPIPRSRRIGDALRRSYEVRNKETANGAAYIFGFDVNR